MRRSRKSLEIKIETAQTTEQRAKAYYELGLFHDNNSREIEAISNYRAALELGLEPKTRAQCLTWLASSLYKTGRLKEAQKTLDESKPITRDQTLLKFITGLERRIKAVLR